MFNFISNRKNDTKNTTHSTIDFPTPFVNSVLSNTPARKTHKFISHFESADECECQYELDFKCECMSAEEAWENGLEDDDSVEEDSRWFKRN